MCGGPRAHHAPAAGMCGFPAPVGPTRWRAVRRGGPMKLVALLTVALVVLATTRVTNAELVNITIGGLYPLTPSSRTNAGMQRQKATELALMVANADAAMLPGVRLNMVVQDTGAKPEKGSTGMFQLVTGSKVPAVVGAASSGVSMAAAQIGGIFKVPLISYSSTSAKLSNKQIYPYFSRTAPVDRLQAKAVVGIFTAVGWKKCAVISATSSYAAGLIDDFEAEASLASIVVDRRAEHPDEANIADTDAARTAYVAAIDAGLRTLETGDARIVVMSNLRGDASNVVWRARELGMIGEGSGWTWIGTEGWIQSADMATTNLCDAACAAANNVAIAGVVGTLPYQDQVALSTWLTNVWDPNVGPDKLTPAQKAGSNLTTWAGSNMNSYAPFAYDCGAAVARALHAFCFAPTVGGLAPVPNASECLKRVQSGQGEFLQQELLKVDFNGPTGRVTLDAQGDRPSDYDIVNVNAGLTVAVVGRWSGVADKVNATIGTCTDFASCPQVYWPGGGGVPSDGHIPKCKRGEELSFSTSGEAFCVSCQEGTYNLQANSQCLPCPVGAICKGGDSLTADLGYWQLQVGLPYEPDPDAVDYGKVTYEPQFFRCRAAPYACCPDGGCAVNESSTQRPPVCSDKRSGVLCSWCDNGYTLWAGTCVPCKGVNAGMVILAIICVAVVLVFLIVRPPSKSGASVVVIDYYQLTNIISVPSTSSGSTVFTYLSLFFNLNPNDVGSACPAELSPLEGAALGYFMPVIMLAELGIMYVVARLWHAHKQRQKKAKQSGVDHGAMSGAGASTGGNERLFKQASRKQVPAPQSDSPVPRQRGKSAKGRGASTAYPVAVKQPESPLSRKFLVAFWRVIFFIYAGLSVTALTLLNCRDVGGEYLVLERFPNVQCWDSAHVAVAVLSFPVLLGVTIGVPGIITTRYRLLRARWNRGLRAEVFEQRRIAQERAAKAGQTVSAMVDEGMVVKIAARFVKRILPPRGYMRDAKMYRAGIRGWFPAAFFLRRAIIIVVAVYLEQDQVWRQIALFVCCLGLLGIQLWYRPFVDRTDDGVAVVAMVALLLVSGVQLYVASVAASQTLTEQHIASGRDVFILLMDVVLLSSPMAYLLWINAGKIYRSVNKRLERGFLCFKPRTSKARMAMIEAVGADQGSAVELGTVGAKKQSERPSGQRGSGNKRLQSRPSQRRPTINHHNPVAFTDMTPDRL